MIPFEKVQFLAVIVAAMLNMVIGSVWYSPSVFGKMWMTAAKVPEREVSEEEMRRSLAVAFCNNLVMAYFLSLLIVMTKVKDFQSMIGTVLVTAVATVIPYELSNHLWEKRSLDLMVVNAGFAIVAMIVVGLINLWI